MKCNHPPEIRRLCHAPGIPLIRKQLHMQINSTRMSRNNTRILHAFNTHAQKLHSVCMLFVHILTIIYDSRSQQPGVPFMRMYTFDTYCKCNASVCILCFAGPSPIDVKYNLWNHSNSICSVRRLFNRLHFCLHAK